MIPYTEAAYKLFHNGVRALSRVEENGVRIDEGYLERTMSEVESKIERLERNLHKSDVVKVWKKVFGQKTNIGSNDQLGTVLFKHLGFDPIGLTPNGKPKTDEKSLSAIDHPFVEDFVKIKKLQKALNTYLKGIRREVVNGYLHPFYNLHLVPTFRSSSTDPNFQNMPIRNPEIGVLVRKAFISRPGCCLIEIDYSGIEVRVAACYHKDPTMIEYINDPSKDMHRDMAIECFMLDPDQVTKQIRYCGKNMFVFPQFYGDYYIDCARALWTAISTMGLKTDDGIPLMEHLESKGIYELGDLDPKEKPRSGTFEKHIRDVENEFWNERFPVYTMWKRRWTELYQKRGWMLTKTGFICKGFMKRNEIINYPIQGSAFHCLLWSLIQLTLKELRSKKMRTKVVGQIHDSILLDVPEREVDDVLILANKVMTKSLVRNWKWLCVPLDVEAEITPVDGNWAEKSQIEIPKA